MIDAWTHPATRAVAAVWLVFVVYWVIAARRVRPNKRVESRTRVLQGVLMLVGGALLSPLSLTLSPAPRRWIEWGPPAQLLGVGLTVVGVGFAIWARSVLGQFWSSVVTLKEGHRLIKEGPYQLVRNPIYTGMLTALLGGAVLNGAAPGLVGFGLFVVAISIKIRLEEKVLRDEFGAEFEEYRRRVKSLVPFVF